MKNYEAIISELSELRLSYEGRYDDDEQWWFSETGGDFVAHIDCPYVGGDSCINEKEGVEYKEASWNDNCIECKSKWLMKEYSIWEW